MVGDFLSTVVRHIAQRNPHFCPSLTVDVVETYLGRHENSALGHFLTIFLGNVVHAHHGVTVRPLLVSDFGVPLAKLRAVSGHAGFFNMTSVWPAHGRPQNSIAHFSPQICSSKNEVLDLTFSTVVFRCRFSTTDRQRFPQAE